MNILKVFITMTVAGILAACAPVQQKPTPMPSYAPEPYIDSLENVHMDSPSLFNQNRAEFLFSDNRARQVGDLVVVHVVEQSSASNRATTTADRESSINLGVNSLFGQNNMNALPLNTATGGLLPGLGPSGAVGNTPMVQANSTSEFEGTGSTTRNSTVSASISARVVRVMDNGVLQIEGARNIKVNGENQIIVVRGLARSRDVSSDNSIMSTHLADAHIEVFGQGILADKQKPGWLARLLDRVWPF
ncbi:flagellar basal body L-ring protein FlgH [Desulfonatronovibrio magnus]|uniref:flagellar basal body L-ring protein FlgH n=1 Tax=Desulfonatronovibrio magnus TaxID=698827 RepID=UPI0005EB9677|nr:flagellar basal body L-ring protein FlgH [Desulfonatronovibrio magnus]